MSGALSPITPTNPGPALTTSQNSVAQLISSGQSTQTQQAVFYPNSLTTADINAAIVTANAAGGGIVQLPAGIIPLTAPGLTMLSNVTLQGVAGAINLFSILAQGGTILLGDGTFNGISINAVDRSGEYGSSTLLWGSMTTGIGIKNLTLNKFLYGIKVGGAFNGGMQDFYIDNIGAINCQAWSFWFENCTLGKVLQLNSYGAKLGNVMHRCSSVLWNFGTYTCIRTFCQNIVGGNGSSTIATRGIVFEATGPSVTMNFTNAFDLQCDGSNLSSTQAATMVNLSANIGVTDGTKFAVNMPVTFSLAVNGFGINKTYIVTSVVGNTIQVAADYAPTGTAIVATGSTPVNITTNGMAGGEFIGTNGGALTNCSFTQADFEQCAGAIMAHGIGNSLETGTLPGVLTQPVVTAISVGADSKITWKNTPIAMDFSSSQYIARYGLKPTSLTPQAGTSFYNTGIGLALDPSNNVVGFFLSGVTATPLTPFDFYNEPSAGILRSSRQIVPGSSNGVYSVQQSGGTTFGIAANSGPQCVMSGAAGVFQISFTPAADTQLGIAFFLVNDSGTSQTVQTTTAGGSLNIRGVVPGTTTAVNATSVTLPANTNMWIRVSKTVAGVYFWAIG